MRNGRAVVFAAVVGLLMPGPLAAHHTGTFLYADTFVTLKGTVKTWLWSNPHCVLAVDVKGENGQAVLWRAETQAPNTIYLEGYRARSFKPGDEVTVTLRGAANGGPFGQLVQALLPDGSKLGSLPGEGARGRGASAPQQP